MEQVFGRKKYYEQLVISHEPAYNDMVKAITIVKDFIIANKLVIYGGSAIDFALRLHGSRIYDDDVLTIPDLDFYSPRHAHHAYTLADALYDAGIHATRTIVGLHTRTMRVDVGDNHFIADISYVPEEIFDTLPFIEYEGMRVIHPDFQRIDAHSALSIPYGNPPTEDVFSRWRKDIERFNILAQFYPIKSTLEAGAPIVRLKLPIDIRHYIFSGVAAYAIISAEYIRAMRDLHLEPAPGLPLTEFELADDYIVVSSMGELELAHADTKKIASELNVTDVKYYESYINLLPEVMTGRFSHEYGECDLRVLSTHNRLISCNVIKIKTGFGANDLVRLRVTGVQYLLKYFLAMYFRCKHGDGMQQMTAPVYLKYYCGLMSMMESYEQAIAGTADAIGLARLSPLFPTLNVYGSDNKSLSYEVNMMWTNFALKRGPRPIIPGNYYPAKTRNHPQFDPSASEIFRESGKPIPQ